MKRRHKTLLFFYSIVQVVFCVKELINEEFESYENKRLTNVIKTVMTSSNHRCAMLCSMTDGCLAVNIIGNHDTRCELKTGLSSESEMQTADNSKLLVLGYNKCTEEPEFCLNAAACEKTWTSAKCHCTDRYQGDRCGICSERFKGEYCDTCTDGYYGNQCQTWFTEHPDTSCDTDLQRDRISDNPGDYDDCKQWCAGRNDCGGFSFDGEKCFFKTTSCELFDRRDIVTFIKKTN